MVSLSVPALGVVCQKENTHFLDPPVLSFVWCCLYFFRVDLENLCNSLISVPHVYWPLTVTL